MKKTFPHLCLASLMLTLALSSCEKVIEFDGDRTESSLVMISKPDTENPWKVRLTESRFFLYSDTIATIKGADVSIEVNGLVPNSPITDRSNGVYDLGYTPQPGDSLTLHVSVPGKGSATAGCRMPQKPAIGGISCTYDTSHYYNYYPDTTVRVGGTISVKLTIDDPANEDNYYMLSVLEPVLQYNSLTEAYDTVYSRAYLTVNDNIIFDMTATDEVFDLGLEENAGKEVLFTDERINGRSHTIAFDFRVYSAAEKSCFVEVHAISRDRYLYEKTLRAAQNQDEFSSLISEPVQIHNNVTGGIGILGGATTARVRVE